MHTRVVLLLSLLAFPALAQRAYVVDVEASSLAAVDLRSGKVASSVPLPFKPDRALLLPDGESVLALFRGEGSTGFWTAEFRPKSPSQAAVIRGGKLVGSTELGWGLAQASFSADGSTAYVLTTGYESNKLPERKPSELLRLDTTTGKIVDRIALDAAAEGFASDGSGKTGIIYSPAYPKKKPTPLPARITFVDLGAFKRGPVLDLQGEIQKPVAVGNLLYVLDAGNRNKAGNLYVIDMNTQALVKTLPLGPEAVMAGSDPAGRVIVLTQAPDKKSGRVLYIKGGEIAGDYVGPAAPKFVSASPDGKRHYIAGWKNLSTVDLEAKKGTDGVEMPSNAIAVLGTRDNKRVFIASRDGDQCCRITTYDTDGMKRLTSFLGGSKGERFGQGLAAVAVSVASYQAGASAARASGASTFSYVIYTPRSGGAARGPLALSPDEKKVYLVDTQTNDITIVDVASGERLKNVDAGSGVKEVLPLYDAGVVAAIADEDVRLIDFATDEIRETIKFAGNVVDALMTPDEKQLVIFGKERIVVLDAKTGKEVARTQSFKQPVQLLFTR